MTKRKDKLFTSSPDHGQLGGSQQIFDEWLSRKTNIEIN